MTMANEPLHAILAPSSASRWGPGGCAGSPDMEARYPEDQDSPEAREGTAAHFYVTEALSGRTVAIGSLAPNGYPVNQEMIEAGYDFIRDVQDTVKAVNNGILKIETRVFAASTVHPQNWGTPDAYLCEKFRRTLHVWDYKYGHRYVDAFNNWQLINYCAAILESEGVPVEDWPHWKITVTIAQPRNYHPDGPLREWFFNGAQLVEKVAQLRAAAYAAREPGAALTTGEHCRDCLARHACPALQRVAMALVDMSLSGQPVDLPPLALGIELRVIRAAMKRLGARATGLEEAALVAARNGVDIPHWRAEYSKGREKWRDTTPISELVTLGEIYGVDLLKPPAAITPTQARKAGIDTEIVKAYSETPRGAMSLVPFDDVDIAKRFS
jgi:hypothetical protein